MDLTPLWKESMCRYDNERVCDLLVRASGPRTVAWVCKATLWPLNYVRERLQDLHSRGMIHADGNGEFRPMTEISIQEKNEAKV